MYIRHSGADIPAAISNAYLSASLQQGARYIEVDVNDSSSFPDEVWGALSQSLGTPLFHLLFQSTSDSFRFVHIEAGEIVRRLQYGCLIEQGLWEIIEGSAEPWETKAFFSDNPLEFIEKDDPEWFTYQAIWQSQTLVANATFPFCNAREAARTAGQYYQFPGW